MQITNEIRATLLKIAHGQRNGNSYAGGWTDEIRLLLDFEQEHGIELYVMPPGNPDVRVLTKLGKQLLTGEDNVEG